MKIEIKNNYQIVLDKSITANFDINDLTAYILERKNEFISDGFSFGKSDLQEAIFDYTERYENLYQENDIDKVKTDWPEVEILNLDELLEFYKEYFI